MRSMNVARPRSGGRAAPILFALAALLALPAPAGAVDLREFDASFLSDLNR
jgi:hypothetical protein